MKKKTLGIFSVLAVSLLAVSMVFAYQGDPNVQGPNYSEERHDAMKDSFENLDYNSWVALMTEDGRYPKIVDVITEDNFDEFVEARNDGTLKEFKASLSLGLGQMNHGNGEALGNNKGQGKGQRNFYKGSK